MLSLEAARDQILARLTPLPVGPVPLRDAHGRFLAEPLIAPLDLPRFDNSAMDGYAVRAVDVASAGQTQPVVLRLVGRSSAGDAAPAPIGPGTCSRVFTGAPLPPGADAVVMQEDTRISADAPDHVAVLDPVKPWENVRFQGEDVKSGQPVLPIGESLTAARVGLASALGVGTVAVRARPRIALLATGNELVEPGQPCSPGQIYESNRAMLTPLIERAGGIPEILPLVPDSLADTTAALAAAWSRNDAVITSGGVSVGDYDFVKPALEALGGTLELWKVAVKPGKPFVFGQWNGKYLFGLPGNPVSALVTFVLLVRPALWRWQGARQVEPHRYWVTAGEAIQNRGDRRHFVRAQLDEAGNARPAGPQASHLLGSMAAADGLLDLPAGAMFAPGDRISFLPLDA